MGTDAFNVVQFKGVNNQLKNINRVVNNLNDYLNEVEYKAYSGAALAMALSGY